MNVCPSSSHMSMDAVRRSPLCLCRGAAEDDTRMECGSALKVVRLHERRAEQHLVADMQGPDAETAADEEAFVEEIALEPLRLPHQTPDLGGVVCRSDDRSRKHERVREERRAVWRVLVEEVAVHESHHAVQGDEMLRRTLAHVHLAHAQQVDKQHGAADEQGPAAARQERARHFPRLSSVCPHSLRGARALTPSARTEGVGPGTATRGAAVHLDQPPPLRRCEPSGQRGDALRSSSRATMSSNVAGSILARTARIESSYASNSRRSKRVPAPVERSGALPAEGPRVEVAHRP